LGHRRSFPEADRRYVKTLSSLTQSGRKFPIGAEVTPAGVDFRVWAPNAWNVSVVVEESAGSTYELHAESGGYFSALVENARAGMRYRYRLNQALDLYPDPASRFQPDGPHGPSMIVDPDTFPWTDASWPGREITGQVIYEMHIGAFTEEGTWVAAARQLPALVDLGVTILEVMPVADFVGTFGWGYDGVNVFAPTRLYGEPAEMKRFIEQAHALGLGVILDVVYNHVGSDGNYLTNYADAYFTDRYKCDWGRPFNFDGPDAAPVREFFLTNAEYWIREFHLDGLRLDATQQIFDASPDHIVAAIARRVRETAGSRKTILIAENEPQDVRLLRPPNRGGFGLDGLWNDDFHHTAHVALTGHSEAYYSDHRGSPQEFVSTVKWGFLFQGQRYAWQNQPRGTPALDIAPPHFVNFLDNHDQIANSARGDRIHSLTDGGCYRALTALLLLAPGTPMLFMGQEYAASRPFLYFADNLPELAVNVRKGREEFLRQFPTLASSSMVHQLADPSERATFERCRLDPNERTVSNPIYRLHRDLLTLRREYPFNAQQHRGVDGAVLGPEAFALRFLTDSPSDRLLIVNLGRDLALVPAPEPLLAPPAGHHWGLLWSSESPSYRGGGVRRVEDEGEWHIPGRAAIVLRPQMFSSPCQKQSSGLHDLMIQQNVSS
jgi:maltooligosyltrehalose trehalohydrolase